MEGFEPPRRLPDLSDFESEPFSHLGTSPERSISLMDAIHYAIFLTLMQALNRGRKGENPSVDIPHLLNESHFSVSVPTME